jgi:hypothetical protein
MIPDFNNSGWEFHESNLHSLCLFHADSYDTVMCSLKCDICCINLLFSTPFTMQSAGEPCGFISFLGDTV